MQAQFRACVGPSRGETFLDAVSFHSGLNVQSNDFPCADAVPFCTAICIFKVMIFNVLTQCRALNVQSDDFQCVAAVPCFEYSK